MSQPSPSSIGSPGWENADIHNIRLAYGTIIRDSKGRERKSYGPYSFGDTYDEEAFNDAQKVIEFLKSDGILQSQPFSFPEQGEIYLSALYYIYQVTYLVGGPVRRDACYPFYKAGTPKIEEGNARFVEEHGSRAEYLIKVGLKPSCKQHFLNLRKYYKFIKKAMISAGGPAGRARPEYQARIERIFGKTFNGMDSIFEKEGPALAAYLSEWAHGGSRRRSRKVNKKGTRKARKAHKKTRGRRRH
jgi:hypothetical protein